MKAFFWRALLACLFGLTLTTPSMGQTPVYNAYEVGKLRAYFDAKSINEYTCNGLMLNKNYDQDDPSTYPGVTWGENAYNKRVTAIKLSYNNWSSSHFKDIGIVLDVSSFALLKSFSLNIPEQSAVVKDCPLLESLTISSWAGEIGTVSCSNLPALTSVLLSSNGLAISKRAALDFSKSSGLKTFEVGKIDVGNAILDKTKVTCLSLSGLDLTQFPYSDYPNVKDLTLGYNSLTSFDPAKLSNSLNSLSLRGNYFSLSALYAINGSVSSFDYAPQRPLVIGNDKVVGSTRVKNIGVDEVLDLSSEYKLGSSVTNFVWKRSSDNTVITPKTSDLGKFTFGKEVEGQVIYCEMSNAQLPSLMKSIYLPYRTCDVCVGSTFKEYHPDEVAKLKAFLNNQTNGKQVNAAYNPNDPSTYGVTWVGVIEKRVQSIDWGAKGLSGDLDFSNLIDLERAYITNNQLKTANFSGCAKLQSLELNINQLTSIDVSGCSQLDWFRCQYNKLTSLNISSLTKLANLEAGNNSLVELNLSSNTLLNRLECGNNQLTSLDVSGCSQLLSFGCSNNKLTSLNISSLTKLTSLNVQNNLLKELDLSTNTLLSSLYCSDNQFKFSSLPVKSSLTTYTYSPQALVPIGKDITVNGSTFKHVGVNEAVDLSAEATVEGKNTVFVWKKRSDGSEVKPTSSTGAKFTFDASLEKETIYCEMRNDVFPNFTGKYPLRTIDVVIGNSFDVYNADEVGKLRAFLDQPSAVVGKTNGQQVDDAYNPNDPSTFGVTWTTDVYEKRVEGISWELKHLSGDLNFSNFTQLNWLYVYSNLLKTVNVSGCTMLRDLMVSSNQLTSIDVYGCSKLCQISCEYNKLTSLNVGSLTELKYIRAYNNSLKELDFSSNTLLSELKCGDNQLTRIDVSGCSQLSLFECQNNELASLNVGSLTKLTTLNVDNNSLRELNLTSNTLLSSLECGNNQLMFSTLPVKSGLKTYTYIPQALVTIGKDMTVNGNTFKNVNVGEIIDLSAEATVDGKNTTFVWKKRSDGSEVKPTSSSGAKFTFDESLAKETIYCEMRNDAFPQFAGDNYLKTVDVAIGNSFDIYNAYEVGKLRAFLDQPSAVAGKTNGLQVNAGYNSNDPSTFGVTWTEAAVEKRAERIVWYNKSLYGDLCFPDFTKLTLFLVYNNQLKTANLSGCTMLKDLHVNSNQLTSIDVSGCNQLWSFNCYNNKLTSLNVGSLTKLTNLYCQSNQFKFSTLPVKSSLTTYSYAPQGYINIGRDTTINGNAKKYIKRGEVVDLSNEIVVGSKPSVFEWKMRRDNSKVTPVSNNEGKFTFGSSLIGESIYCEMNNAAFPDFAGSNVLHTVDVLVTDAYNQSDVGKLKAFLQQESAISGQKNYQRIGLEVDINDPSSWPLVEWTASSTNKRVKSIIWMRKDLAGNLDLSGLDSLKSVELTTNKIASANFSGCTKLEKIWLDENTVTSINTSTLASLKELNVNYNKITQLDLSANTKLEEAEFASNLLTTVKLPNTPTLGSVRATRNNFKLSTLPPALSQYYSYFYQPQNPMVIGDAVQENGKTIYKVGSYTTIDLSSELTIGGKTTTYSWYNVSKKADITPRTSANGKFSFDNTVEGDTLICYMRNESFPDFTMLYPFETVKVLVVSGYNQYEVGKLKAFLDQPSSVAGKTNGQQVNAAYDPNDPSTFGVSWTETAIDKQVASISWATKRLSGNLDFSNFTRLGWFYIYGNQLKTANVSGCTILNNLQVDNNQLTSVDVSGCSQLSCFECQGNKLTSLNVGSLTKLTSLNAQNNKLKELDLNSNTLLSILYCGDNLLKFSTLPVKSNLTTYTYTPQGLIEIGKDITVYGNTFKHVGVNDAIDLSAEATIGGETTTFVWKKRRDGSVVTPETNNGGKFTFNTSLTNEAIFCEMSNATFPSFTGNNILKTIDVVVGDNPNPYNKYEVDKLKTFLNQPSAVAGKTNGQQVSSAYNPEDPSTYGVTWSSDFFEKKVTSIGWSAKSLAGNLDLSGFTSIESIGGDWNSLTGVNVRGCSSLRLLYLYENKLTLLDVFACGKLESLFCQNNQLETVDLSTTPLLTYFDVSFNSLNSLDLKSQNSLYKLSCDNNRLTYSTMPTRAASITTFSCVPQKKVEIGEKQIAGTTEKYFLGADQVVDLSKEDIVKGVQTTFTWKDSYGSVVTPTTSNGGKFTFNSTFVGKKLYCEMANAGFPDFVGYNILKTVTVEIVPAYNQNDVDKLKVFLNKPSQESGKTNGQQLNTTYNPEDPATYGVAWSRHNVNKRVINFQWYDKKLSGDLDLSGCELLNDVFISNNKIPSVNFKECSSLVNLYAESNEIASASFDKHPLLESVDISLNKLTSLAIPEAPMISYLFAADNKLSQIDLSKMASLTRVKLMRNEFSSMDVSGLTKLQMLKVEGNKITGVKFGGNEQLVLVNLDNNQLSSVDVSSLTSLSDLALSNNKLLLSRLPLSKAAYTNYSYAPQPLMAVGHAKQEGNDVKYFICAEEPLDLSSELNVGGNVTTFVWKKADGTVVLPTTSNNGVFTFSTDLIGETLYGELSNASFPDFAGDKVFKTVKFTVLSPYNEEEVAKLLGFFGRPSINGATNGSSIGISKMNNPNSWRGIEWTSEVSDRRVKSINWASLGIADTLNVSNFVKLNSVDVSDNKLTKIISNNTPLLKRGLFSSNSLKFSTMPTSTSFDEYNCFPQDKLEIGKKADNGSYTLMAGEYIDLSSEVAVEGQATNFIWKDEAGKTIIPTKAENGRFAFNNDFIGLKIYCELSNSIFPNGSIQTVFVLIPSSKFESKFGKEVSIAVYPNPTTSILKVEIDEVIREYRIYSVRGVLVKSGSINDFKAEINVQTLTSGTYLLELTDGAKVYRSKFIKQ
ncbi:T9SS type A sorting domain-containing protein [uncultured Acetobacteroides sp.]|uniref:T9SS type A sorting domain-containing protein n=1 Tax=uncultured Acetobacteroides sp. TaxID=1760811 RepID=UPI0029F4AF72|nr:T9SS type A sorting domain-containing protein [uncultured Acetobacteroides sp.]